MQETRQGDAVHPLTRRTDGLLAPHPPAAVPGPRGDGVSAYRSGCPRSGVTERHEIDRPVRLTRPYRALVAQLQLAAGFRSAADLHVALRREGQRVGLSTVYRRLHELTLSGQVDSVRGGAGERLFRLRRGHAHTHYLFCRRCGAGVEIGDDLLEEWLHTIVSTHGYTDARHDVAASGVCPDCSAELVVTSPAGADHVSDRAGVDGAPRG